MLLFKNSRLIELIEKNSILISHQDNINDSPKFKKKLLLV